ncbi:hypothetical protein EMIT048CA2_10466 [Pseudomonas chlororaphis]
MSIRREDPPKDGAALSVPDANRLPQAAPFNDAGDICKYNLDISQGG